MISQGRASKRRSTASPKRSTWVRELQSFNNGVSEFVRLARYLILPSSVLGLWYLFTYLAKNDIPLPLTVASFPFLLIMVAVIGLGIAILITFYSLAPVIVRGSQFKLGAKPKVRLGKQVWYPTQHAFYSLSWFLLFAAPAGIWLLLLLHSQIPSHAMAGVTVLGVWCVWAFLYGFAVQCATRPCGASGDLKSRTKRLKSRILRDRHRTDSPGLSWEFSRSERIRIAFRSAVGRERGAIEIGFSGSAVALLGFISSFFFVLVIVWVELVSTHLEGYLAIALFLFANYIAMMPVTYGEEGRIRGIIASPIVLIFAIVVMSTVHTSIAPYLGSAALQAMGVGGGIERRYYLPERPKERMPANLLDECAGNDPMCATRRLIVYLSFGETAYVRLSGKPQTPIYEISPTPRLVITKD